ncbi:MAG: hypothetical protein ACSNEK_02900 [Parachlamydiaceae bacterium]
MIKVQSVPASQAISFQASKWLHLAILCDVAELKSLFEALGEKRIVATAGVRNVGEEVINEAKFLENYARYIDALKNGVEIPPSQLFLWFTTAISVDLDHFFKIPVTETRGIIRVQKPVIQIQPHWFSYSLTDKKIRSGTFSLDNISWGLQFSYPQLYENPSSKQIHKVLLDPSFTNTPLFKILQKWVRENSRATPFKIGDDTINAPIRIGMQCFPWISQHKGLANKGIHVA